MRVIAIIKRICLQMVRDKRTLALLLIAPIFILTLMHYLFDSSNTKLTVFAVNINKSVIEALRENDVKVVTHAKSVNLNNLENTDGELIKENGKLTLTLRNDDPTAARTLQMKVTKAVAAAVPAIPAGISGIKPLEITTNYIYGNEKTTFFDVFSTVLIGFFVFFFVFLIAGIGLLRERTTGTLERLVSTPVKRGEIVAGYLLGYGIFAIVQTIAVVFYAVSVLDIVIEGSVWYVILINLLLAFAALSLGILLSAFASSEFQMLQFIPIIIVPQIFFAGIIPVEGMPGWLQAIAKIMPLYYGADALKSVMYLGKGFSAIKGDLLALTIFTVIFVVLNIQALKKYRKL